MFIFTTLFIAGGASSADWLFHSAWFIFLNMLLFSLSNGHFASLCMIYGPDAVPPEAKEVAGMVMNASLNMGIFVGALAAEFGMNKIHLAALRF